MICILTILAIAFVQLLQHGQTLGTRSMALMATPKVEVCSFESPAPLVQANISPSRTI